MLFFLELNLYTCSNIVKRTTGRQKDSLLGEILSDLPPLKLFLLQQVSSNQVGWKTMLVNVKHSDSLLLY